MPTFRFQIHPLLPLGALALVLGFLLVRLLAFLDPWVLGTGTHLALTNMVVASIVACVLLLLTVAAIALYVIGWIGLVLGLALTALSPFVARLPQSSAD